MPRIGNQRSALDEVQGSTKESVMLRKSTMLALAAVAALGLAATTANSKPGGPGIGIKHRGVGSRGITPPGGIRIIPSDPIVAKPSLPVKPIFVPPWPKPKPGIIVKPVPVFVPRPVVVG